MNNFANMINKACVRADSLVCVGLDPDPQLMPIPNIFEFNKTIIESTSGYVAAYKPNLAFYEAHGISGLRALYDTVDFIKQLSSSPVIIGDAKRGDIGSTNEAYATALFDTWGFDAITVNPYCGWESLQPFLKYEEKGVFVLCRTSNTGASEFQDLQVTIPGQVSSAPLFEAVALESASWNAAGNIGFVLGATKPEEIGRIRSLCPGMPFLIPGIGSQGGELDLSLSLGADLDTPNILINSSRSIIYASSNPNSFGDASTRAVSSLCEKINQVVRGLDRYDN